MRRASQTLSRLNAASVLLAAAALLAFGTVAPTVAAAKSPSLGSGAGTSNNQDGTSFAYAVPRNAPSPDMEVVLPQPLPPSAVAQYQRILSLQADDDFTAADRLISRLDDTTLVGPILADRYLGPGYRTTPAELLSWYEQYNNQPAAAAIYTLMQHKIPAAALPLSPQFSLLPDAPNTGFRSFHPTVSSDSPLWRNVFVEGLTDWKRGDIEGAEPLFARAADMSGASDDDQSAAAFWAARAALRLQQPEDYLTWLHTAAGNPDTFYGMLAGRLLGEGFGPTGLAATLTEADITAVDALPNGHLAFALLQIGETDQAGLALRALWPDMQNNPALASAVMAVAARAGLVDVAIGIAGQGIADTGNEIAGARLPLPNLQPAGGFTIDPALLYALARTESGFDSGAVSACGARGMMQLMPETAHFIARNQGITGSVSNPATSLALGQAYIRYLGDQPGIEDNLLAILASYNAGPGAAQSWYDALQDDSDPLLFIETIPNDQTRHFIHDVLTDSWIYAEEIGLRPASLDDLAQGNFPTLSTQTALAAAN
jgi:soluble lytic murein transglycosylase-like protein